MKAALAAAVVALSCAAAAADDGAGSAELSQTLGSRGYSLTRGKATLDVGKTASITPSVSIYRSDDVNGTYDTFGLRGDYEPGRWSFGAEAAVQPRTDGYAKSSLGGDAAYAFPLGDAEDAHLDAGAGATLTRHSDQFAAAAGGRGRGARRGDELVVRQSDLFVFGALRAERFVLSGRASKSSYNQDLASLSARRAPDLALGGFDAAVTGFPDSSVSARLRLKGRRVRPFLSYAHTTFELGDPPANAWEAGATVPAGRADVTAAYERYLQSGFAPRGYVTLAVALDF